MLMVYFTVFTVLIYEAEQHSYLHLAGMEIGPEITCRLLKVKEEICIMN